MVVDRATDDVLAATAMLMLPLPDPEPADTVAHGAPLDADHAQPSAVVTPTVPVPPAAGKDCVVEDAEYVHDGDPATWKTVNAWLPAVMVV